MHFETNINGYSVIELLVVLLLLAILSSSFSRYSLKSRIKLTCKKTEHFLNDAQAKAFATNKRINLEVSNTEVKELDSNFKLSLPNGTYFKLVQFGNLTYGSNTISFEADSWASPGKLVLAREGHGICTIYQSILGARRIE